MGKSGQEFTSLRQEGRCVYAAAWQEHTSQTRQGEGGLTAILLSSLLRACESPAPPLTATVSSHVDETCLPPTVAASAGCPRHLTIRQDAIIIQARACLLAPRWLASVPNIITSTWKIRDSATRSVARTSQIGQFPYQKSCPPACTITIVEE